MSELHCIPTMQEESYTRHERNKIDIIQRSFYVCCFRGGLLVMRHDLSDPVAHTRRVYTHAWCRDWAVSSGAIIGEGLGDATCWKGHASSSSHCSLLDGLFFIGYVFHYHLMPGIPSHYSPPWMVVACRSIGMWSKKGCEMTISLQKSDRGIEGAAIRNKTNETIN